MIERTFYSDYVDYMFRNQVDIQEDADEFVDAFGLLHAAIGLAAEAAECLDVVKKHVFTGKEFDRKALILEMGDVEFYMQALRNEIMVVRDEVLNENVLKLEERHPSGFADSTFYTGDIA